jgi:uncharacterized protein YdeI (YjbR/CyaY-like superfamily)
VPIEREAVFFQDRALLRRWLAENNAQTQGIWAQFYKKSTGLSDMNWEVLVEECLCFGWIDSLPGTVDETRTQVYISPRKPNSGWSRRNKLILNELRKRGLLEASGLAAIERAKANGSWERFDMAESLAITPELAAVFAGDNIFARAWGQLTESKKRQFLQQIYDAKTDATRTKRIESVRQSIGD